MNRRFDFINNAQYPVFKGIVGIESGVLSYVDVMLNTSGQYFAFDCMNEQILKTNPKEIKLYLNEYNKTTQCFETELQLRCVGGNYITIRNVRMFNVAPSGGYDIVMPYSFLRLFKSELVLPGNDVEKGMLKLNNLESDVIELEYNELGIVSGLRYI